MFKIMNSPSNMQTAHAAHDKTANKQTNKKTTSENAAIFSLTP